MQHHSLATHLYLTPTRRPYLRIAGLSVDDGSSASRCRDSGALAGSRHPAIKAVDGVFRPRPQPSLRAL